LVGFLFIKQGYKDKKKLSKIFKYKWYDFDNKMSFDIFNKISEFKKTLKNSKIQFEIESSKTIFGDEKNKYNFPHSYFNIIIEPIYKNGIIPGKIYQGISISIGPKANIEDPRVRQLIDLIERTYKPIFN
jgi:hypothetical protein